MSQYQVVTDRIIEQLSAGVAPWVRPWTSAPLQMPRNGTTGRPYSGINVLLLWAAGYSDPRWATFRQAKAAGGSVRKGERATVITYFRFIDVDADDATVARGDAGESPRGRRIPLLKTFCVFNYEQIAFEGTDLEAAGEPDQVGDGFDVAREFIGALPADIRHGGDRAYYTTAGDYIRVPPVDAFRSPAEYLAVVCHELIHWTGAEARLDRQFGARFGDDAYAAEELVAELGAAFLCAELGIRGRLQHAEYLSHWLRVLGSDQYAIFTAAKAAQKAVEQLRATADERRGATGQTVAA